MKLSAAFLALFVSSAASLSHEASMKLMRNARKLDQGDNTYNFLADYNLKFVGCDRTTQMTNQDNQVTYGAAMLRLCPTANGCDSSKVGGCKEGFGDIVVSIQDYVDAFMEEQADNMNWDDNMDHDKFAECKEYEPDNDGDDNAYADMVFYVGPSCTADGTDVMLGFFTDEACSTFSTVSFSDVSNGWTLPYSSGGLISKSCTDCLGYDEDNAAYQLREMCTTLYQEAGMKCETGMETYSSYGKDETACEGIKTMLPKAARVKTSHAGKVFGWIVFIGLIAGVAGYVMWWRKKKQQASGAADGMLA